MISSASVPKITCAVCGEPGVSICAKCSKKGRRYKTALAQAHPLLERDPALYKRLDQMSRLPLKGNKKSWDDFCVEIGAGRYYEYMPILVEIMQEGKWRTDTLYPMKWLRENLANRVKRVSAPEEGEDYPTGKRRPGGPRFDKRSGLLISHGTRPYAEFGGVNQRGDAFSPEDAVDNQVARRDLQTAGGSDDDGHIVMPADRDTSSRILRKKTLTEWLDAGLMMTLLERDWTAFDKLVRQAIVKLRPLASRLGPGAVARPEPEAQSPASSTPASRNLAMPGETDQTPVTV